MAIGDPGGGEGREADGRKIFGPGASGVVRYPNTGVNLRVREHIGVRLLTSPHDTRRTILLICSAGPLTITYRLELPPVEVTGCSHKVT